MPAPIVIRSEVFRPLSALSVIQQGPAAYYRELRKSSDPILQTAAWVALLDGKLVRMGEWEGLVAASRFGAVRSRAFALFQSILEHELARQVAGMDGASLTDLQRQQMLAELRNDHAAAAEFAGAQFTETAEPAPLEAAALQAELSGGWRPALQWAVRMVAASPFSPGPLARVFKLLESAAQPELLEEIAGVLAARNLHLETVQIFLATAALGRGEPQRCLTLLRRLDDARMANPALTRYLSIVRAIRATAEERAGNYSQAYTLYAAMNEAERAKDISPADFFTGVESRLRLPIPTLPADQHPPVVQMLGFPRSGTTLLENALAAHPAVQTFEEIRALDATFIAIDQALDKQPAADLPADVYMRARQRYYAELQFQSAKPGASVLVDKMPIRSAEATTIARLFPEWRYIFSIRHPFDVVLSCFKQRFKPNIAMENFRTIEASIRLYDFTMTAWFKQHGLDDPAVHYVRYDDLVTDFERVVRETLDFLHVEWNDAVLNFAEVSAARAAKTPSYRKVRQGLSIGVQSSWRNYGFLFQTVEAKPLHRWAEFFGYPTA